MMVNATDNMTDVINTVADNALHMYNINTLIGKFNTKPIAVSIKDSFHAVLLLKNLIIT